MEVKIEILQKEILPYTPAYILSPLQILKNSNFVLFHLHFQHLSITSSPYISFHICISPKSTLNISDLY